MSRRQIVQLSTCAPGFRFRLFSKYRDGAPRPRFRFGKLFLCQHELEVIEHHGDVTLVKCGNAVVPVCSSLAVAL